MITSLEETDRDESGAVIGKVQAQAERRRLWLMGIFHFQSVQLPSADRIEENQLVLEKRIQRPAIRREGAVAQLPDRIPSATVNAKSRLAGLWIPDENGSAARCHPLAIGRKRRGMRAIRVPLGLGLHRPAGHIPEIDRWAVALRSGQRFAIR